MFRSTICWAVPTFRKKQKSSPPFKTTSCSLRLFRASGISRILRFPGFLIFWTGFKLVKKSQQRKQLLPIQTAHPLNDLFSVHSAFLSVETFRPLFTCAGIISQEAPMKKLVSFFLAALLICSAAAADPVDLSGMSYDELVALRDQINLAIWNSQEWQEVTVPEGIWIVGEDIPAGHWSIRVAAEKDYFYVSCFDKLNETEKNARPRRPPCPAGYRFARIQRLRRKNSRIRRPDSGGRLVLQVRRGCHLYPLRWQARPRL